MFVDYIKLIMFVKDKNDILQIGDIVACETEHLTIDQLKAWADRVRANTNIPDGNVRRMVLALLDTAIKLKVG